MQLRKAVILPRKLPIPFQLGVDTLHRIFIRPPHLEGAGAHRPVIRLQHAVILEVLIPYKCRVRLPAEHLQRQLKALIGYGHIAVHILKAPGSKGKGRFSGRGFLRETGADTETVKLHAFDIHRDRNSMRPGGEGHAADKGSPEGTPPVRPPQAAFREIFCAAVQRHINAVFVPEGIAEPHRHIVGSRCVHRKTVGHRAVIAQGCDAVFNGYNAGRRGIIAGVPVDVYRSELGFLLFAVGSQVAPAVVCPHKLGILTGNGVRPFHVVVDMGKGIGHLIVIVPIGHDGEKGLRRRIVREIVAPRHPQLGGVVGVGRSPVAFPQVLRRVVDLPVPAVGGHTEEDFVRVHDLRGVVVDALQPASW